MMELWCSGFNFDTGFIKRKIMTSFEWCRKPETFFWHRFFLVANIWLYNAIIWCSWDSDEHEHPHDMKTELGMVSYTKYQHSFDMTYYGRKSLISPESWLKNHCSPGWCMAWNPRMMGAWWVGYASSTGQEYFWWFLFVILRAQDFKSFRFFF